MSNKSLDEMNIHYAGIIAQAQNQIRQWYIVAMFELKLDPSMISAIGKRVEELERE